VQKIKVSLFSVFLLLTSSNIGSAQIRPVRVAVASGFCAGEFRYEGIGDDSAFVDEVHDHLISSDQTPAALKRSLRNALRLRLLELYPPGWARLTKVRCKLFVKSFGNDPFCPEGQMPEKSSMLGFHSYALALSPTYPSLNKIGYAWSFKIAIPNGTQKLVKAAASHAGTQKSLNAISDVSDEPITGFTCVESTPCVEDCPIPPPTDTIDPGIVDPLPPDDGATPTPEPTIDPNEPPLPPEEVPTPEPTPTPDDGVPPDGEF